MQFKTVKLALLAASVAVVSGCADNTQLKEVQSMAAAAMTKANEAYNLATVANTNASDANFAAQEAQNTANAALECCNANSSKLDRMFQKAMSK